jgi:retinol dehydrogenase-12
MKRAATSQSISLITGATSGIGRAAAMALAQRGHRLALIGRNEKKLRRVEQALRSRKPGTDVRSYVCDLSVLGNVKRVAGDIRGRYDVVDVLVNNAGGRYLRHQLTEEGFELTLATNYLGHFALTLSLIDLLCRSRWGKVINVSSGAHTGGRGLIENIRSADRYNGKFQYAESKLASVLFTYALADRLTAAHVGIFAVDPGGAATNFARNNGIKHWLKHRLAHLIRGELRTPAQGADTIVYLASSEDVDGMRSGFFKDRKQRRSSELSYDKALQERLWASSVEWSGVDL